MKITSLRIRVCQPKDWQFSWRDDIPPVKMTMTVFEIGTAEGHTGVSTSWLPASPVEIADQANHFFRPLIVGAAFYGPRRPLVRIRTTASACGTR